MTLLPIVASGLFAFHAAADEKETCVRSVEHAQVDRLDGKLLEARRGFVTCARTVCPAAIRQDCAGWLMEVEATLPSIVLQAVWPDGADVHGMTVLVDGKPVVADKARAVALDPGDHTVRFEVAGAAPLETRYVLREGEKNRILRVTLTPLAPTFPRYPSSAVVGASSAAVPSPSLSPSTTATPAAPSELSSPDVRTASTRRAPVPLGAYILGGVALSGFAGLLYFGLKGTHELDAMRSTCRHACNPSDVDRAYNQVVIGDILGSLGLVAAGVAVWLTLTRPNAAVDYR